MAATRRSPSFSRTSRPTSISAPARVRRFRPPPSIRRSAGMCLIVVGWRAHPDYPLVVAANRDEFHARPTADAARWPDAPRVIGGRDLEAGGTWLGITEMGRFAAVTNVREPGMAKGEISRGALTREFLLSSEAASDYAKNIEPNRYSGFNLLLADGDSLFYCSNRDGEPRPLPPGIYGLSNHL